MNIQSLLLIAGGFFIAFLVVIRTVRSRRLFPILVLLAPMFVISLRWAAYRNTWAEWILGFAASILGLVIWWLAYGRKLGPARSSSIKVWSEDEPFE